MNGTTQERPGVYSSYDASAASYGSGKSSTIGIAALAANGTADKAVTLTGYAAGIAAFGKDGAGKAGMETLLRILFAGGATTVIAVKVGGTGSLADYERAFAALSAEESVQLVVCDSTETAVQQKLRDAVCAASENRCERIAVVGGKNETVEALVTHAQALNSERMLLVGPDALDCDGASPLSGAFSAAAVAAAIAIARDPAIPLNGAPLKGLGGLGARYTDGDIDTLVRGGVTPLEMVAGILSPVRGITTRTKTGAVADTTWREATTILIVDSVIPAIRNALRARFTRSKNTPQARGAIRSQVIVELENKKRAEIIDSYGEVSVKADETDPTICLVEFGFAVAHGLNQIYLTAHITV